MDLPRGWVCPLLKDKGQGCYMGGLPARRVLLHLCGSAEGLRWQSLSGIEKPGSGTEPIHQEHMRCSRFRGSCPSDVKSAGHPEPGFSIPLSVCTAALCAPTETQKNPAGREPSHIASLSFVLKQRAYPTPRKIQEINYFNRALLCTNCSFEWTILRIAPAGCFFVPWESVRTE